MGVCSLNVSKLDFQNENNDSIESSLNKVVRPTS